MSVTLYFVIVLSILDNSMLRVIDLLAALQETFYRAIFSFNLCEKLDMRREAVMTTFVVLHIRKFYDLYQNIVRLQFLVVTEKSIASW